MDLNVIYLLIIIFAPILPAFIFFKFLPKNKAAVAGPFKGFQVKIAGAFAGYFLIFIILIGYVKPLLKPPSTSEKLDFEIIGRTVYNQRPLKSIVLTAHEYYQDSLIRSKTYITDINGEFKFNFSDITKEERIDLVWEDPKGQSVHRHFSPTQTSNDIVFENPITLIPE